MALPCPLPEAGALNKRRNFGPLPNGFREGRCGEVTAPHGWEAENARYYGRLQRGKGAASFPLTQWATFNQTGNGKSRGCVLCFRRYELKQVYSNRAGFKMQSAFVSVFGKLLSLFGIYEVFVAEL